MKTMRTLVVSAGALLGLSVASSPGVDSTWTNTAASGNFTNAANWNNGVPTAVDSARFGNGLSLTVDFTSDASNANVFLNSGSGTITFNVSNNTYTVTNTFLLGELPLANIAGSFLSGNVFVTNANQNAALIVGQAGKGIVSLNGATVTVDQLIATNSTAGSPVRFNSGTLNVRAGSTLTPISGNNVLIGATAGQAATWNILGGTNLVNVGGANTEIGNGGTGFVYVTGLNTVWTNTGDLRVGRAGAGGYGELTVSDGAKVYSTNGIVGDFTVGKAVIGTNSLWQMPRSLTVGSSASGSQLIITNGGSVVNGYIAYVGENSAAQSNQVIVTGTGSVWSNQNQLYIGRFGSRSELRVEEGGYVYALAAYVADGAASTSNQIVVTGNGSTFQTPLLYVGYNGNNNQLIVTNGGQVLVDGADAYVSGYTGTAVSNSIVITGPNSFLRTHRLFVGSNTVSKGQGNVLVTDGGTLQVNQMHTGFLGTGNITNQGGVYQFTNGAPAFAINTAGSIVLDTGTISYRGVTNADIVNAQVAQFAYFGNNTFRLDSSTNKPIASYRFDSVANTSTATNYQRLAMINNGSHWQSATLTIGSGGELLVSNSVSRINAAIISTGAVRVVNSMLTVGSNVVIHGQYISDPSTNTFLGDVTVSPNGSIAGGAGDLFDFKKSFLIQRPGNPNALFDLASSTVSFSGGAPGSPVIHTNAISGDDFGYTNNVGLPDGFTAVNFSYGRLTLGSTNDTVCFQCGVTPPDSSNALYVTFLDLTSLTNQASVSWLVTNLLHAPTTINLYYFNGDPRNSYLGNLSYQLSDCNGAVGGLLMPAVPEPSALLLAAVAACVILRRKQA